MGRTGSTKNLKKTPRELRRKIHLPNGKVWSYKIGNLYVHIRDPEGNTTEATVSAITGESWSDIERAEWKGYWKGVSPSQIRAFIERELQ